jgi:hypothetical protein
MKRFTPILILTVFIFLSACAPAQKDSTPTQIPAITSTPSAGNTKAGIANLGRTDSQGAVTVEVTPLDLDKPGNTLKFDVAMNTHMVNLSMDLLTLATLTTDTGLNIQPTLWDAPKGGHHVDGTLSFPTAKDGKSILDGAKQLTLTISGIDNATRTFTWNLSTK